MHAGLQDSVSPLTPAASLQLLQFEYDTTDCEPTQRRLQVWGWLWVLLV